MNIKTFWTAQGQMLGEVLFGQDGKMKIKNPVFLFPQKDGVKIFPILATTTSNEMFLNINDILYGGQMFEPIPQIKDKFISYYQQSLMPMMNGSDDEPKMTLELTTDPK